MIGRRILALSLVLIVCACGRTGTPQAQPYESIDDLLNALEDAGAEIVTISQDALLFDVDSRAIMLNGEKTELYEFENAYERERGVIHLQALLEDIWKNTADELSSARLWSHDRLIVAYFGRDGGTILLLSGLLGDPLQEPGFADDEPYPPAVPAAIHALAEARGEDPSLITVLSYTFVVWSDGCLEYPHPDEDCTQALTSGWRILLQLGEQEVEIHSDEMGGEIRWR
ncbi:MAG: hypothetical protein GQ524_04335 [Anaerolineales bacterium]|nr:hypothetical protein [Anaerolineales bacterium]